MACKVCESMRSVWEKFAAQRARRHERRKAESHKPPFRNPVPPDKL